MRIVQQTFFESRTFGSAQQTPFYKLDDSTDHENKWQLYCTRILDAVSYVS